MLPVDPARDCRICGRPVASLPSPVEATCARCGTGARSATARTLAAIAEAGGRRCCARDSFIALRGGAAALEEFLGVSLAMPGRIACEHSHRNRERHRVACPFFPEPLG